MVSPFLKLSGSVAMAFLLFLGSVMVAEAQDKPKRTSPMRTASAMVNGNEVSITYSAPSVKGREIWGSLVPYDKVWRTGANEATTISFKKDAKVNGKDVKAGKYSLFTIPGKSEWTIIINAVWDQWGASNYDASEDILRFTSKPQKLDAPQEEMMFEVGANGQITLKWDTLGVSFAVE
jgi:hypothetical protein